MSRARVDKNKVFVGMSGGVDSSVAAMLLKNQGYDVAGVYLKCYVQPDGSCMRDAMDAMAVAEKLEIPFHIWDFRKEYEERVINYMIEGYRQGLTPNPDIECNREIKFGLFLEKALRWGADYVATGHYVKIQENRPFGTGGSRVPATRAHLHSPRPNFRVAEDQALAKSESSLKNDFPEFSLFGAEDKNKDQSYFLWTLTQKQLRHALFPIGDYLKSEVREMAREARLPTAEKKDSQGICFLGKVTLDEFLKSYLPERHGEVLSVAGEKLGEHNGAHFYTIGQRHIGIKYQVSSIKREGKHETKPLYVAVKDVRANTLTVAEDGDENLAKTEVLLTGLNFINSAYYSLIRTNKRIDVMARVRYRQSLFKAKLQKLEARNSRSKTWKLVFDEPQKFVAPGQSAVFYTEDGDPSTGSGLRMLGGGVIL